jgi:hypothetical protein
MLQRTINEAIENKHNKNIELRNDDRVDSGLGEGLFVASHYAGAAEFARLE